MNVAAAKTKLQYLFSFTPEDVLKRIILYKISRVYGVSVSVSTKDLRSILGFENHGLETMFGRLLSELSRRNLLKPIRRSRPRSYLITSRLLETLFGLNYQVLRTKPAVYLSRLEIFYLTLKLKEAGEKEWL